MNKLEYEKKQERKRILEYEKQFKKSRLMTTRFNNATEEENRKYREKKNFSGCFYNTSSMISSQIPRDMNMFVLEMNNDKNRIIGVGLFINKPVYEYYKVYSNSDYNTYTYYGKYRIDRETMTPEEEFTMQIFDKLCFEGQNHMKRGQGITAFPTKILYRCREMVDLVKSVEDMFKKRIKKPIEEKSI
jgi:hypothetical protein